MHIFHLDAFAYKLLGYILAHEKNGLLEISITDLAFNLNTSRITIRKAIKRLQDENIVRASQGNTLTPGQFRLCSQLRYLSDHFKVQQTASFDNLKEPSEASKDSSGKLPGKKLTKQLTRRLSSEKESKSDSLVKKLPHSNKSKSIRKEHKGSGKILTNLLSPDETVLLLRDASKILGITIGIGLDSMYGKKARASANARIKEGFTKDQLLDACRYAVKEWESGNKFRGLKDVVRVWSTDFVPLLSTKGEWGKKSQAPTFRTGEAREEWIKDLEERRQGHEGDK